MLVRVGGWRQCGGNAGKAGAYWDNGDVSRHWCVYLWLGLDGPVGWVVLLWWWWWVRFRLLVWVSRVVSPLLCWVLNWGHWLAGGSVRVCVGLAALRWDGAGGRGLRCGRVWGGVCKVGRDRLRSYRFLSGGGLGRERRRDVWVGRGG